MFWHGLGDDGGRAAPLAHLLEDRFRVVAPDAPGFGGSPAVGPETYRGAALGSLVHELLDALALERAAFVGHSWGAWVGCHAAAAAPGRLRALVLLDGGYTDPDDWGLPARVASLADCVELGRRRSVPDPETWAAAFYATLQPPYVSATYAALAAAALPVLLLAAGEETSAADGRAGARGLERFRSALPDADVRVLAGVGHDVPADPAAVALVAGWPPLAG